MNRLLKDDMNKTKGREREHSVIERNYFGWDFQERHF